MKSNEWRERVTTDFRISKKEKNREKRGGKMKTFFFLTDLV